MSGGRVSNKAGGRLLALSVIVLGAALALFGSADGAGAADRRGSSSGVFVSEMTDVQRVKVTVNKSRTFRVERPFTTIVAGNPEMIDVKPLGDKTIYVLGKRTGTTNVVLFDDDARQIGVLDVDVVIDTGILQQNIQSSTGSSGIRVGSSNGQIVISGLASNSVAADRAVQVAKTMVPEGNVVNAMTVAPSQQVMLRVRFLEVARTAGREIGVNWFGANNAGNRGFATGLGTSSAGGRPAIGPTQSLAGCGTPPCVDASGNPVSRRTRTAHQLAAGHRVFRYSIL